MRSVKRIFVSLLVLFILCSSVLLTSCEKDREYNGEQVERAAQALLKNCEILNTVYYGKGINYITSSNQNGIYYEADFIHLDKLGFKTIAELEALTYSTYSTSVAEDIFASKLNSLISEGVQGEFCRYYQKFDDEVNKKNPVCIMVNSNMKPIFDDRMTYDYSSVKATHSKGDLVFITVNAEVTDSDGKSQVQVLEIALVEQSGGWRIATPSTFCNYNPYKDIYDGLNK